MKWLKLRKWQRLGFVSGLGVVGAILMLFEQGFLDTMIASGPMNTGHEALDCGDCHQEERGTTRQQVQAFVSWWRGEREDVVYVGTRPAESSACMDCHDRPDDRHPVYRFREPRFADAREELGADQCASCHVEHNGVRVTQEATFCESCHDDLEMKNDPLDVSHAELVSQESWGSCLTCHDFHGNHLYDVPTRMSDAFSETAVQAYLDGEHHLYSEEKKHRAKE